MIFLKEEISKLWSNFSGRWQPPSWARRMQTQVVGPFLKSRQRLTPYVDVQSLSRVRLCNPTDFSMPGFPILHHLPELAQTHAHLIFCYPLLLLPSIFSSIRVFSNELALRISGQSIGASGSASVLHRQKTGLKIPIFYFKKFDKDKTPTITTWYFWRKK